MKSQMQSWFYEDPENTYDTKGQKVKEFILIKWRTNLHKGKISYQSTYSFYVELQTLKQAVVN